MEIKHPKFYKELRRRNKLDQVISKTEATADGARALGPGLKPRGTRIKLQATSFKLQDSFSFEQKELRKFRGPLIKGLYQDKTILRMLHMKRNLVW